MAVGHSFLVLTLPTSMRSRMVSSQPVPSRQGVHCPHDSCLVCPWVAMEVRLVWWCYVCAGRWWGKKIQTTVTRSVHTKEGRQ